jgi:hypothetical protein
VSELCLNRDGLGENKVMENSLIVCFCLFIICLFAYCFTLRPGIVHLYGDVTIAGEGLQNLGLCSAFMVFQQGGIFIVPQLL